MRWLRVSWSDFRDETILRLLHIHSRHYHRRHESQSKVADSRIGVAAKSSLMRRVTGGCDDTLELYLEKYIGEDQAAGRREEIDDEETKRTGSTSLPTMPIIVSRSLEGESTIVFSDTWRRAVIVIGTRHRCYIGYLILFNVMLGTYLYQKSVWWSVIIIQIEVLPALSSLCIDKVFFF